MSNNLLQTKALETNMGYVRQVARTLTDSLKGLIADLV